MHQHLQERISNFVLRPHYKWIWQGIFTLAAVGLVTICAFSYLFTTFVPWDDEGCFLQAYRDSLSNRIPYDQVFSIYGPFTFCSAAIIARFNAVNVTHDNFRWALLPVWIVIASLIAGVVWRWTGRFSATVVVFLLVGFRLKGLANGVGHPQVWIILAVAVLLCLGLDWIYLTGRQRRAFWTGFGIGVILLCKINIGIFVSVAIALAISLQLRDRLRTLVCVALMAAVGLGLLLFFKGSIASEKYFVFAYLGSLGATVGIALHRPVDQKPSLTSLRWLVAGFGICLCAGVGIILIWGTTLRALFRSLITEPALIAISYHHPFQNATQRNSILLSVLAIGTAIVTFRWRRLADLRPAWLGLLKVVAGTGLLCAFSYNYAQALAGSLLFLWLLIVDAPPMSEPPYSNRLLLAVLCPLFSLQIFPIAGDQIDWAALLPITAAAVLVGDGINYIERESVRKKIPRLTRLVAGGTGAVLAILLFLFGGGKAVQRYRQWRDAQPVNLPGTHWLRLPPIETARLTVTVSGLSRNCRTVLTLPGMYSFSLWSGVKPAEEKRFTAWPTLWPDEVLKNELPKLRQQNQGCVLVSSDMYQFFRQLAVSSGNDKLLSEIQRTMRPIFAFQDLTLYESSQRPEIPPNSAALIDRQSPPTE